MKINSDYFKSKVQEDIENIICTVPNINQLKKCNILITGANGMLAKFMTYVLIKLNIDRGYQIKIYVLSRNENSLRQSFGFYDNENIKYIVTDITDNFDLPKDIDYVIHAASNSNPESLIKNPIGVSKANLIGTYNVLDNIGSSNIKNVKNFLFLSTREIYGDVITENPEVDESTYGVVKPDQVRSVYPLSKLCAENILLAYQKEQGLEFSIARLAHVYGPGMTLNDGRIMSDIVGSAVNEESISLKSDGSTIRSVCYISDAVSALFLILLNKNSDRVFNVSNEDEPMSIYDIASIAAQYTNKLVTIPTQNTTTSSGYSTMRTTRLSNDKLKQLGWESKVSTKAGVERTIGGYMNEQ